MTTGSVSRALKLARPLDVALTLRLLRRGVGDPTMRIRDREVWRASRASRGPATLRVTSSGTLLEAEAWGPGREETLESVPDLVGFRDTVDDFEPGHPLVSRLHRQRPGLRIPRTNAVLEAIVPAVLEQKVTGLEFRRSWRRMVLSFSEPAPGPGGLVLPPSAEELIARSYPEWHPLGVERRRAEVIRELARHARRLEAMSSLPPSESARRLLAFPGVGPWTVAEVALRAFGDSDAVSVGDYHVPHLVSWALAGERRGSDARMLELLEPYRGHRGRVVRLLELGAAHPPRRGPRLPPRNHVRSGW